MAEGDRLLRLRSQRTGLNPQDFGPFLITHLVGLDCRMMLVGPRLGALVADASLVPVKYFA